MSTTDLPSLPETPAGVSDVRAPAFPLATGSDVWEVQFLTSSGWQTDRTLDSESLAIAHFFAIGKANVWTGHVRIQHGERTVKSTLHPNTEVRHARADSGASPSVEASPE